MKQKNEGPTLERQPETNSKNLGRSITHARMWAGGPLRQFSSRFFNGSVPVVGGNAGAFICDIYDHVCPDEGEDGGIKLHRGEGLMPDMWLCVPCGERFEHDKALKKQKLRRLAQGSAPLVEQRCFFATH